MTPKPAPQEWTAKHDDLAAKRQNLIGVIFDYLTDADIPNETAAVMATEIVALTHRYTGDAEAVA